jgi:hypothetical protein
MLQFKEIMADKSIKYWISTLFKEQKMSVCQNAKLWVCARMLVIIALLVPTSSFSAMHLSLSGSHSDSNAGLQKIQGGSLSGSVSFDLGSYFRLGYTHLQQLQSAAGYTQDADTKEYTAIKSKSHVVSHSVDLTAVLYAGEIFTPYVFVGMGVKSYNIENKEGDKPAEKISVAIPNPNGGAGMAVRLTQKFSLKLTYTVSPGVKQEPNKPQESTTDSYAQVGIQYTL